MCPDDLYNDEQFYNWKDVFEQIVKRLEFTLQEILYFFSGNSCTL